MGPGSFVFLSAAFHVELRFIVFRALRFRGLFAASLRGLHPAASFGHYVSSRKLIDRAFAPRPMRLRAFCFPGWPFWPS